MPDLEELQAALDAFIRRYDEFRASGIPRDEALRHIVNAAPCSPSVPGFTPGGKVRPDLEERVAALEKLALHPLRIAEPAPMSDEQAARFKKEYEDALRDIGRQPLRILPSVPPLTPGQVRHLLRECVTVVKPGETLVIRGRDWTPNQIRELQRVMDAICEDGRIGFKVLIVLGEELGVVQPDDSGRGEAGAEHLL
jgi:hypothetical protein